jgi:hypothetical protein
MTIFHLMPDEFIGISMKFEHFHARQLKARALMKTWRELGFSLLLASSFKINFDIAIQDFFYVQAVFFHNHNGHIIRTVSQISLPCLPNFDEALATLLAVFLANSFILIVLLSKVTLK